MAKKKASRKSEDTGNDNRQTHNQEKAPETDKKATALSRQSSMDDHDSSEEKLQNLKSLNAILLKQTMEKRHQIESLVQAKDEMETELARYGSEKTGMRDELDQVSDENFGLKMELALVMDYVENRFREMGVGVERLMRERDDRESEIRVLKGETNELMGKVEIEKEQLKKVCDERDSIKNGLELQREKANRLKESVIRLEEKESSLEIVIGKLRSENDRLVTERRVKEEIIEKVNEEKIDLEKTIEEKKKEIDEFKREIKVLLGVKNEMESVKIDQMKEIEELEEKLEKMNETVQSLTKEERVLRDLVIRLEKNLDESMEKERAMMVQIDALGKEKAIKESELERVIEEKISVEKQMEMVNFEKEKLIDELSREKSELEGCISTREAKLVELNKNVDELTQAVAVLQKACNDQTMTNATLSCKVGELSNALAQVELKREEADKALDEEKRRGEVLKAEVMKSETMIQTTLEELEKTKIARESFFTAKCGLESESESLKQEKAILEKELAELKKAVDALRRELESAGMDAKRSLVMLKRAASKVVAQSESKEDKQENGTESYAVELCSIEKAFRNKEEMIEEMKKEAETMKQSTEEAHKKKSFWTLVSSVTTIFAAASIAYAARIR
ncbi:unnamed protein product [Microthlaspi erraticum]|uniref:Uncharacterized protein n=1 Tax=Microthlaspi erraticum TaxID=1685480 RepID=A0A6D2JMR1_9BRAS|nr:unnamed protein product [Microthlaspi erraticum]